MTVSSVTLGELALRQVHVGAAAPTRYLFIGGENFSSRLDSVSAEFDPDSGGSGMSIQVKDSLEGLEDAPVTLYVGYGGRTTAYFVGRLQEPSSLKEGRASAYGPFKLMADQYFGETVRYRGVSIGYVLRDIGQRAGFGNGMVEILRGDSYMVEALDFTEETSLGEAAKAAADPANFVFYDRPNFRRAAMPAPRPGSGGKAKFHYSERNYPKGQFTTTEAREGHYSKVIVFRRDDNGNNVVRAVAPVPNRGFYTPPANRVFYVPEFPGDAASASQEAYEIADRLAFGELGFSLGGIWINPELELFDSITTERTEIRRPPLADKRPGKEQRKGKWLVTYRCLLDAPLTLKVSRTEHHMSLGGGAVQIAERKLPDPIRLRLATTPGLITQKLKINPIGTDSTGFWYDSALAKDENGAPWIGLDATGAWIDPAKAGGRAGYDGKGFWFDFDI